MTSADTIPLTLGALEELSEDNTVQNAFKRMDISKAHSWTNNTANKVQFIIRECGLQTGDTVLDFGCGQGRHVLELAKHGMTAVGIDYVDRNIAIANKKKIAQNANNTQFYIGDCREYSTGFKAKSILCLYDVIGTYADNEENIKILQNIVHHLMPGGIALISVMNYELTVVQARNKFVLRENPNALLDLRPSNIMETTGDIFDPDYYLVDTESGIVYRGEQFKRGRALPIELIVRDKRFTKTEIMKMCQQVGLEVEYARYVNARNWERDLLPTSKSAKEILLKCKKPLGSV